MDVRGSPNLTNVSPLFLFSHAIRAAKFVGDSGVSLVTSMRINSRGSSVLCIPNTAMGPAIVERRFGASCVSLFETSHLLDMGFGHSSP